MLWRWPEFVERVGRAAKRDAHLSGVAACSVEFPVDGPDRWGGRTAAMYTAIVAAKLNEVDIMVPVRRAPRREGPCQL